MAIRRQPISRGGTNRVRTPIRSTGTPARTGGVPSRGVPPAVRSGAPSRGVPPAVRRATPIIGGPGTTNKQILPRRQVGTAHGTGVNLKADPNSMGKVQTYGGTGKVQTYGGRRQVGTAHGTGVPAPKRVRPSVPAPSVPPRRASIEPVAKPTNPIHRVPESGSRVPPMTNVKSADRVRTPRAATGKAAHRIPSRFTPRAATGKAAHRIPSRRRR